VLKRSSFPSVRITFLALLRKASPGASHQFAN
jgi:hypothetical protein